jgi:diacylglycerol O-acyltransferase / wax synthase
VKRLTGLDASFLYAETPTSHMHLLAVAMLDSVAGRPLDSDAIIGRLAERLAVVPAFRRRLVATPLSLDHPVWIEDPRFVLADHVRRVAIPPPGDRADLARVVGEHAGRPLDRGRPLWGLWIVEGLRDGQVALVFKLHHAIADGTSGLAMLSGLFDAEPQPVTTTVVDDDWTPEAEPSALDRLVPAAARLPRRLALAFHALTRAGVSAVKVVSLARTPQLEGTTPFSAPRTRFNRAITPQRSIAFATVPMNTVREIKERAGLTMNDVIVAVVAGALRRYLSDRDELPTRALVAVVPSAVSNSGAGANAVSAFFTRLSTHVRDPLERLRLTGRADRDAKRFHEAISQTLLAGFAELAPPLLMSRGADLYSRLRIADHQPPIHTLVVSNVAGPVSPIYFAGARASTIFALGPIYDGAALNVTVASYADSLSFGILSCPDVVPDVGAIAAEIPEALSELCVAVTSTGVG